jgi:HEAT repeat protein
LGPHASPATDELIEFLFDDRIPVALRQIPVEALALIGSRHPDALPALLELFRYAPPTERGIHPGEVTALRELAAEAFAVMQAEADLAVPLLSRAVRDPSEAECIRRKSLVALGKIGPGAVVAVPAILESLEFDESEAARDEAARALARIGGAAHQRMLQYLAHPDAAVRWRVAGAIGEIKMPPQELLVALRRVASDADDTVRLAAVESLGRLKDDPRTFLPAAIDLLTSDDRQIRMRAMRLVLSHQPLDPKAIARIEGLADHPDRGTAGIARLVLRKLKAESPE